ncbi:MAG: HAD family hydrolase [Nocardioidaceae bacterium]
MTTPYVVRLAMWSGPRNISTAWMRSWENRPNTMVVDEPLYAHYLSTTGLDHPGRDEVIAAGEADWRVVVETLLGPVPAGVDVFYQKHMAHHLTPDIDHDWIASLANVLLIRDPREVVASYIRAWGRGPRHEVTPDDIGLPQQARLYDELAAAGAAPLVIDAADFLGNPRGYLAALCARLGVTFDAVAMLRWPAGVRETDGVWGKHWYEAVWRSTGFEPYQRRHMLLDERAAQLAAGCLPLYERLRKMRWLASDRQV